MPGPDSGRMTLENTCDAAAAEVQRGLNEPVVDLHDDRVERQDHVRQIVIHHAEDDSAVRSDQRQRADADALQKRIDDAGILQHADPGQCAEQKAHAHGKHDEHFEKPLRKRLTLRDEIRDRIANDQADERSKQTQPDRAQENRQIGAHARKIGKRELTGNGICQCIIDRQCPAG